MSLNQAAALDSGTKATPDYIWGFAVFFVIVIVGGMATLMAGPQRTFVQPHIQAPAFEWPAGCTAKSYTRYDEIASSCNSSKYAFSDAKKYGFAPIGDEGYARVGNDAIAFGSCWNGACKAVSVVHDVFYQK